MTEYAGDRPVALSKAVARLESWFSSIRDERGYYGPSVGANGWNMAYCGPSFDWKYEGLFRAYAARGQSTGKSIYLDLIGQDVDAILRAQWRNGCFSVSHFENNPCEGGMPHEPAMLSAVCRVLPLLDTHGNGQLSRVYDVIEKYVSEYLIRLLWNKTLRTFNSWPTSDFVSYNPHCVASALELLIHYAALTNAGDRFESYILEGGKSILASQITEGPLRGGIPAASLDCGEVYPYWAIRCAPALRLLAQKTQAAEFSNALALLMEFVRPYAGAVTTCPRAVYADRPPCAFPFIVGAGADMVLRLLDAELIDRDAALRQAESLIRHQLPTGAFRTAVGFGGRKRARDWRDFMPVCGWQDKIYALLSLFSSGESPDAEGVTPFETEVRVLWRRVQFRETADEIVLKKRNGATLYQWRKKTPWPSVCLL